MIIETLPIQIKTSDNKIVKTEFIQAINSDYGVKPKHRSGMWSSSLINQDGKITSDWVEWCRAENFGPDKQDWYLLYPKPKIKIFQIDNIDDCVWLDTNDFLIKENIIHTGLNHMSMDFVKLKKAGFDGINLTEEGQHATRWHKLYSLYGWDCESTVWLNWNFTRVELYIRDENASFIL